jgi:cystathionine beta-lyase family protein involved in aluminum resistance
MVQRRELVGGGLVAGLATLVASGAEAAPALDDEQTARALNELRETFERQSAQVYSGKWRGISRVRHEQRTWLKATRKYPDFLEVGLDVWDNVYDWHVAYQQPLNVRQLADGRYAMAVMFTTLLLRPDQSPDFVGYPFDTDAQGRTR